MRSYGEWWAVAGWGGLVSTIVVGMFLCLLSLGCQRGSHAPKSSHVAECRISYFGGADGISGEVCLNDISLIDRLVLQPMKDAKRASDSVDYAVVAELTIISPDGSRETLDLFSPWGHYKRGSDYFVADFSELQTACEEALATAQRRMDSVRVPGSKAEKGSAAEGGSGDPGS